MKKLLFALALLLLPLSACTFPIYKPIGLGLPNSLSSQEVMNSVESGVILAGWDVENRAKVHLTSSHQANDALAKVFIEYDPKTMIVRFSYLDSENLHYEKTGIKETISYRYNLNLEHLEKTVALSLAEIIARP